MRDKSQIQPSDSEPFTTDLDPVTFEVLSSAFTAVVDEMGIMLERVSFSTVTTIGKDYACGLCTPEGEVFSRGAGGLPLFGGTIGHRVGAVIAAIRPERLLDGDVFVHNDPFLGGTHAQDVSAVMPVFSAGQLVAFVHAASHWPDVGGPVPGSFNANATSTYAEGLLIPPIHLVRAGEWDEEVEALLLRNVRVQQVIRGDLRGLVEACRMGRSELHRLLEQYGVGVVRAAQTGLMSLTERLLRQEVTSLADGTYSWTDYIDKDPCGPTDSPVPVVVSLTIDGDRAKYSFVGTAPAAVGPVNCPRSSTEAACIATTQAIFPAIPLNDGLRRVIEFDLPEDLVLSARYPSPVSGHGANAAEKIVSCIHGCFMQVAPDRAMACPTNLMNMAISGVDGRGGRAAEFVFYLWLCGGWGARPARRDNGTYVTPLAAGTHVQPLESLEREYPIHFMAFELMQDSEGPGKHRSGFGVRLPFRMTSGEARLSTMGDREVMRPWGIEGGGEPKYGNGLVYGSDWSNPVNIGAMRPDQPIEANVPLELWQSGGGGWGAPLDRCLEWVVEDVLDGLVSRQRAETVYGVIMRGPESPDDSPRLDEEGSIALRAELRARASKRRDE